jgi:hypothetical protein
MAQAIVIVSNGIGIGIKDRSIVGGGGTIGSGHIVL